MSKNQETKTTDQEQNIITLQNEIKDLKEKASKRKPARSTLLFERTDKEITPSSFIKNKDQIKELNTQKCLLIQSMVKGKQYTLEQIDLNAVNNGMQTRQDSGKISGFYKNELIKHGYIKQCTLAEVSK